MPIASAHPSQKPAASLEPSGSACGIPLQLQQVTKSYRSGRFCLDNVNFQLQAGAFALLTGPSGAGKSTLLKLFYGAEHPDRGQVLVQGQYINRLRGRALAYLRRQVGVIFQDYKLLERRTVAENVGFVLAARGLAWSEIQRRVPAALSLVGLADRGNCFPDALSGGEQQRVSIARAIVGQPRILLADEPTGNLDRQNALQVLKILQQLNKKGLTVLMTTHDPHLVEIAQAPVWQIQAGRLDPVTPAQPEAAQ